MRNHERWDARRGPAPQKQTEAASDLQARYERLLGLVLRTGAWLESVPASGADLPVWEGAFAEHRANLRALQSLRERLQAESRTDELEATYERRAA